MKWTIWSNWKSIAPNKGNQKSKQMTKKSKSYVGKNNQYLCYKSTTGWGQFHGKSPFFNCLYVLTKAIISGKAKLLLEKPTFFIINFTYLLSQQVQNCQEVFGSLVPSILDMGLARWDSMAILDLYNYFR